MADMQHGEAIPYSPHKPNPVHDSQLSVLSSLHLPDPILSPNNSLSSARPTKIPLIPLVIPYDTNKPAQDRSLPDTLTIRPRADSRAASTIRPSSRVRHLAEYHRILAGLKRSMPDSLETVVPRKLVIDEVEVEWCVICGKENMREKMELREIGQAEEGGQSGHYGEGEKGGGKDDFRGRAKTWEKGVWWVCQEGCRV